MEQEQINGFGSIPNDAESFGQIRKGAEEFGSVPTLSERDSSHTLTVRDAARMFEQAGVARTERSIINWCQPNRLGVSRLDSYYDPNERKYFLTPESVERAIVEEIARASRHDDSIPNRSAVGAESKEALNAANQAAAGAQKIDSEQVASLEKEILDLRILNGGKDFVIDQLRKERDGFIQQLVEGSRRIGQLESDLRRLSIPKNEHDQNASVN